MINYSRLEALRTKLKQGNPTVGSWLQLGSFSVAEILSRSSFDWIVVDHEHGIIVSQPEVLYSTISKSTLVFARIPSFNNRAAIHALEAGAEGIIVPNLVDAQEWYNFSQSVRWPPHGSRGVGFCVANDFGSSFDDYKSFASNPFVVPMVESKEGIIALREIASSKTIDAILIGPYDLSASLDCLGDFTCDIFLRALNDILDICRSNGVPAGIHIVYPDEAQLHEYISNGFQFLAYGMDSIMIRSLVNPLSQ